MSDERVHRAVSADGTEIAGRVRGRGPALVLVHGGIGDGDIAWGALLRHLTDRFTCYLPSTRGRGLSSDNPDHSPARLGEDVTAFVDSIGELVCLVGWSGSGAWVLGAAVRSGSVAAVAAYEPFVVSVMREDDLARTSATMEQVGMAAADGRLVDAARAFAAWICTDNEIVALEETDFYERWAGPSRRCSGSSSRTRPMQGPGRPTPKRSGRLPRRSCSCVAGRRCSAPSSPMRRSTLPSTSPIRMSASCRAPAIPPQ